MNVLELAQQIYNDQQRLKAKQLNDYVVAPIYELDEIQFTVCRFVDVTMGDYSYMKFDKDCKFIGFHGYNKLDKNESDWLLNDLADALKQYLAQEVE